MPLPKSRFDTLQQLLDFLNHTTYTNNLVITDVDINFEFNLSKLYNRFKTYTNKDGIKIYKRINLIQVYNVVFVKEVLLNINLEIQFSVVKFKSFFSMIEYSGIKKVPFYRCTFYQSFSIRNSTFSEELNFNDCAFYKVFIISYSKFQNAIVLSDSQFYDNVSFLYSVFLNECTFQSVTFKKGLDISNNRFLGDFNFTNSFLGYYKSSVINEMPKNSKSELLLRSGIIPIKNKRSTYRF